MEVVIQCKRCSWEIVTEVRFDRKTGRVFEDTPAVRESIKHAETSGSEHENFVIRGNQLEEGSSRLILTSQKNGGVSQAALFVGTVIVR